jgi:large subunit ribosomal protein L10
MRAEKKFITAEYLARLNASPFFIVVEYTGLKVPHFNELRSRLRKSGAEAHVVKNSIFRIAAKEAGLADLTGTLAGQLAVVTGPKDVTASAKTLKNFAAEFEKAKVKFGYLGSKRLEAADLEVMADLPSIEVLRGKIVGLIQAPAQKLAALISTPGSQVARIIKAKADKGA